MSPIDEEKLDELLERWAAREEEAAPSLAPPEELRRRVAGRAPGRLLRLARCAAAAAVLVALISIGRHLLAPGPAPFERVAWGLAGAPEVDGPRLMMTRGPKKGGAFAQLLFQVHRVGGIRCASFDLERPPAEPVELAAGDRWRLGVRPAGERFLYVFAAHGGGGAVRLFPAEAYAPGSNPVPALESFYLPAEPDWIGGRVAPGETVLYVIASRESLPELESAAAPPPAELERLRSDSPRGIEVVRFTSLRR